MVLLETNRQYIATWRAKHRDKNNEYQRKLMRERRNGKQKLLYSYEHVARVFRAIRI